MAPSWTWASDPLGRFSIFMLNSFPIALVAGALLGFLAGLGTGGGSLLLLWLTLIIGIESETARTINLLFFLTAAGSVSVLRLKKGAVQLKRILPGMVAGCMAAAGFSILGRYMDANILKKFFGVLLLITGLRELFYRPRKAR